nr:hypothetical protein [uncultured Haemophilus sp.]
MTKKMTNADALALLAENAAANTKAVKELTALLGEVTTKPENGKNGETPYIKDGNWWIGEKDTGVRAAFSIPVAAFYTRVEPQEVLPQDSDKIASGDYVEDRKNTTTVIEVGQKYNGWHAFIFREGSFLTATVVNGIVTATYHEEDYSQFGLQVFLYKPENANARSYYHVKATDKPTEDKDEITLSSLTEVYIPYDGGGTEIGLIILKGKDKQGEETERKLEKNKDILEVVEIEKNGSEAIYFSSNYPSDNEVEFYPDESGFLERNYAFSASAKSVRIEITTKEGFTISRTVENPTYHG